VVGVYNLRQKGTSKQTLTQIHRGGMWWYQPLVVKGISISYRVFYKIFYKKISFFYKTTNFYLFLGVKKVQKYSCNLQYCFAILLFLVLFFMFLFTTYLLCVYVGIFN
jgi:hypothetical protein